MFVRKDFFMSHQCRSKDGRVIERSGHLPLVAEATENGCGYAGNVCYQCGKAFSSQSNLNKHMKVCCHTLHRYWYTGEWRGVGTQRRAEIALGDTELL